MLMLKDAHIMCEMCRGNIYVYIYIYIYIYIISVPYGEAALQRCYH